MEILLNGENKNIVLNPENNFITNVSWEENIVQYEHDILQSIINPKINYETNRFGFKPYTYSGIYQDTIWFNFYFYGVGTGHTGGLNYEKVGLTSTENSKLTVNISESFFRLDFYKIPSLSGGELNYLNKRLVFTKNLRIPLGEKVYYTPIYDNIYVPIFMGSKNRNEENMYMFWFNDDSVLNDETLTGDTFYMTAKYFNALDGSVMDFTNTSKVEGSVINASTDVYYKLNIDKSNNTYSFDDYFGQNSKPIKFFATSVWG